MSRKLKTRSWMLSAAHKLKIIPSIFTTVKCAVGWHSLARLKPMIVSPQLRSRLSGVLCAGCRRGDPIDELGRHVREFTQEAFGSEWQSKSWIKCSAGQLDRIVHVIEQTCPRCGVGVDNDGDGNCANCAWMPR